MIPFRLRLITNLDCNFSCSFCYQNKKDALRISPEDVRKKLNDFGYHFTRASIMGGESTLYVDELVEHVRIAKDFCDILSLTTNGSLLTSQLMKRLKEVGLKQLGVSIPSLKNFNDITHGDLNEVLSNLKNSKKFFKNVRVNITQNSFNIDDEIYEMIVYFLDSEFGVVICEDINSSFSMCFEEKLSAKLIHDDGCGFLTYELPDKRAFGMFYHQEKYDETDLIITPVGDFLSWKKYCASVNEHVVC